MNEKRSPQVSEVQIEDHYMDFGSAMNELLNGERVRRLDWEDEKIYLTLRDDQLMIFKTEDNLLHPLTVSAGDIAGTDWIIVGRIEIVH